jgi:hypothetical protein
LGVLNKNNNNKQWRERKKNKNKIKIRKLGIRKLKKMESRRHRVKSKKGICIKGIY